MVLSHRSNFPPASDNHQHNIACEQLPHSYTTLRWLMLLAAALYDEPMNLHQVVHIGGACRAPVFHQAGLEGCLDRISPARKSITFCEDLK